MPDHQQPVSGLAQNIYEAINELQFEGEIVLQEEEVSGQILSRQFVQFDRQRQFQNGRP